MRGLQQDGGTTLSRTAVVGLAFLQRSLWSEEARYEAQIVPKADCAGKFSRLTPNWREGAVIRLLGAGPNHKDACQSRILVAMPTARRSMAETTWKVSRDLRLWTWTINRNLLPANHQGHGARKNS